LKKAAKNAFASNRFFAPNSGSWYVFFEEKNTNQEESLRAFGPGITGKPTLKPKPPKKEKTKRKQKPAGAGFCFLLFLGKIHKKGFCILFPLVPVAFSVRPRVWAVRVSSLAPSCLPSLARSSFLRLALIYSLRVLAFLLLGSLSLFLLFFFFFLFYFLLLFLLFLPFF